MIALLFGVGAAAPARAVAGPAHPFDFNGDGYADLAVGTPMQRTRGLAWAGGVSVLYGSATGLTARGDQLWTQASRGIRGRPEAYDDFGSALASGDIDADGYADLVVGVPGERDADGRLAGGIAVLFGSPTGLAAARNERWLGTDLAGVPTTRSFGAAVAVGDFNGDGFADVAAGAPDTDPDGAGLAVVLYGSATGLAGAGSTVLDRTMTGAPAEPLTYYQFGNPLVASDFDGDAIDDLAVGISGGGRTGGEVAVFRGSASGISTVSPQLWSQDSPGIDNGGSSDDVFGAALAAGDFNGDGRADLATGNERAEYPACGNACSGSGEVIVLYGSGDGLTATGSQLWRQSTPGVPGSDESFDYFGDALAAGDLDGDARDDLAIGVSGENGGASNGRGRVVILYGTSAGLDADRAQAWTQASAGVPDRPEKGDRFGMSLVAGNFGRSGRDDLAIGVPRESLAGVNHAGMVIVLYGRASGLSGVRAQGWSKATRGVKGDPAHEYFGLVLGTGTQ